MSAEPHIMPSEPHPFTAPDADLILRSSAPAPVEFRLHKCLLAAASPFFAHMFELPQPRDERADAACIPVVDVSEDARTLEDLLRCVYPVARPALATFEELTAALEAAAKYDMPAATAHLRHELLAPRFVDADPLRAYAIACRFELEDEARAASRATLRVRVLDAPLSDDLRHVSAWAYHRLLALHAQRGAAAQALLVLPDSVRCVMCNGTHYGAFYPPRWWKDYEARARKELAARPTSDVVFGMGFLAESARAGCERCAGSILDAHWFFEKLRKSIDELPDTV
ncbi:BTB/POZ domain-containing protein [Phanerochaete sordida]|uniref:BTB/POZ domain-containing protein n=1 Tax=Phanerochaete sordida TaxID=48140 RepID=A0A9P3LAW4_9APHY|nr:BTB/POZ domain-containing protein [Phanerochaete sordida]